LCHREKAGEETSMGDSLRGGGESMVVKLHFRATDDLYKGHFPNAMFTPFFQRKFNRI
jgi:hypothetical protein